MESHDMAATTDPPRRPLSMNLDRKSTRLNSSHTVISYAVFCLKKKKNTSRYSQSIWLSCPFRQVCNKTVRPIYQTDTPHRAGPTLPQTVHHMKEALR